MRGCDVMRCWFPAHFRWTYKMAGMKLHGETKVEEYEANRRVVMESSGGIKAVNVKA